MSRFVSFLGVLLALSFMALSATINWRYGHSIGRNDADQLIYAAISLAADVAKALAPFFLWYAAKNRRLMPATASGLLWLVCTSYSLSSAAGFAELNRAELSGGFAAKRSDHAGLQDELARKEGQLKALGAYEMPSILEQKLAALRQNPRWSSSRECADATLKESRKFCTEYRGLEAEMQKGIEASRLEQEIAGLRSRVSGLAGAAEVSGGDPRAGFIIRLTGWNELPIQNGFSILFIALLEIGSGLGLFIALSHGGLVPERQRGELALPQPVRPCAPLAIQHGSAPTATSAIVQSAQKLGDVAKFARACMAPAEGQSVSFEDLYSAYERWCNEQACKAMSRAEFDRSFLLLCDKVGFKHAGRGRQLVCLHLKLGRPDETGT